MGHAFDAERPVVVGPLARNARAREGRPAPEPPYPSSPSPPSNGHNSLWGYSSAPSSISVDDTVCPSGATISIGMPATLASNADFLLAPQISRRMLVRWVAGTGVILIAR